MQIKARKEFARKRIIKGFSLIALAEKMKVNPSVVSSMEKGNGVRPATARKACEALHEDFDALFVVVE